MEKARQWQHNGFKDFSGPKTLGNPSSQGHIAKNMAFFVTNPDLPEPSGRKTRKLSAGRSRYPLGLANGVVS